MQQTNFYNCKPRESVAFLCTLIIIGWFLLNGPGKKDNSCVVFKKAAPFHCFSVVMRNGKVNGISCTPEDQLNIFPAGIVAVSAIFSPRPVKEIRIGADRHLVIVFQINV